jgi:hypothetical protein
MYVNKVKSPDLVQGI